MKKCPDCDKEVDKSMMVCEYCGKLVHDKEQEKSPRRKEFGRKKSPRGK